MKNRFIFLIVFAFVFALAATNASAIETTLTPMMDNTMYDGNLASETDPEFTDNTCGAGTNSFIGTQVRGGFARRALVKFNVAGMIPAGSTINSVSLTIDINRAGDNQDAPATLHLASQAWGEGVDDCDAVGGGGQGIQAPADGTAATWSHALFNTTPWVTPGGDFGLARATSTLTTRGPGVWDSAANPAMVSDVQSWLDNPAGNNGWVIVGDETRSPTSRRFSTREGRTPPALLIDYTPSGPVEECCDADGVFNGACSLVPAGTCATPPPIPNADPTCSPNPCPQPVGACCNLDESCSELVTRATCLANGGDFQGDGSQCNDNNVDCGLEPFVDPLPRPAVLAPVSTRPDGVQQYEVTMTEERQQLHRDLPNTDVWTYNGTYPGPTIEAITNEPIEVKYINSLPDISALEVDTCAHGPNYWRNTSRTVVHLHGGHVPPRVDGNPEFDFFPGSFDVYEYPNNQPPATIWYHDHALGTTRLNVYMGMAAFYLIRDPQNDTVEPQLPQGQYEIPIVIQDREFNPDGSFFYAPTIVNASYGDKILVNGKVWPFLDVDQGKYRLRLLNGSNARQYNLTLENVTTPGGPVPTMHLIGTDGGYISAPIQLTEFMMGGAERFDMVFDFAGLAPGTEIVLRNTDQTQPIVPNVMKFIVTNVVGDTRPLPTTLLAVPPIPENEAVISRRFLLEQINDICAGKEWVIKSLDAQGNVIGEKWDDKTEFPVLGTTEIWEFENPSVMMHPMHMHLVFFQVLSRTDLATGQALPLMPWEANTWKDTVRALPGTSTRVIAHFDDYAGRFPYHCHILDHEDHEMMREFVTINDPNGPVGCVAAGTCTPGDGICEVGEDCQSVPGDCAIVSGALCGNGLCEIGDGEDFITCPADCNGRDKGKNTFNCGSTDPADPGYKCGFEIDAATGKPIFNSVLFDGCITNDFFCRVKAKVPACCGDDLCEGEETAANCVADCTPRPAECIPTGPEGPFGDPTCADGIDNDCDGAVDANDTDCQEQCVPTEPTEVSCFDTLDNDCDTAFDCADTDCEGSIGPATTCGIGECAATGNRTCSGGAEVDTCTPGTPGIEGPPGDATCGDGLDNDCDGATDLNDPDCVDVVCENITNRNECNNTSGCEWQGSRKNGMCVTVGGGQCTDNDGDGYGNPGDASCPNGAATDCDDNDATVNPGAIEGPPGDATCTDGKDNDCDGLSDMNDPGCMQAPDCSIYGNEATCEADQNCRWRKKQQVCVNR